MGNIDNELLINELIRQNPWWKDPSAYAQDPKTGKRDVYDALLAQVTGNTLITAVTGLRRIGKTTIVKQIINYLLVHTGDPRSILYFSFEEATLAAVPQLLEQLIRYQVQKYPTGTLFFFLDEIQYVNLWNAILKKYVDNDERLKFVVTGSSSLFLKTQAQETLAGRILETVMHPLGFGEYMRLIRGVRIPAAELFSLQPLLSHVELLKKEFHPYLLFGEFPYVSRLGSFLDQKQYILDWVIGKIVEQDLPKLRRFVRGEELRNLSNILINGSGVLIELQNLASDVGIDRKTLAAYLDVLEKTRLIGTVLNHGGGFRTRHARQRKIYSSSVNTVAAYTTSGIDSESFAFHLGQLVENFVYSYLHRHQEMNVFFWRQRGKEVDFILENRDTILPIEVKYQHQLRNDDIKNLLYVCRKRNLEKAIVVTKDHLEERVISGVVLAFIPAYFLV